MSEMTAPLGTISLADLMRDGVFIDGDWVESKDQDPDGEVRLIQLADIGDAVFRDRSARFLTMEKAKELRCTFLEPGDVLVARMPEPLGRACLFPGVNQPAVTVVDVCVLRPSPDRVRPEWLVKAINSPSFRTSMQEFVRGTTRQRISRKNLGSLQLSVPSMEQQARHALLVDRVEAARSIATSHLQAARRAVEHLRHAVLAAACSGRLTAHWRDQNPAIPSVITRPPVRPRQFTSLESFDLPEIPAGWQWVQLDDLLPPGGIFDGPFGSNLKSSDYTESGARVIRLENIGHLQFFDSKKTYVSPEKFHLLSRHAVRPGDIIFSSFVEEQIRVCQLPKTLEPIALAKADCFTIRPGENVTSEYLLLQLASAGSYRHLAAGVHGATRPRVNTTQLRSLPIALCSLAEQEQIVRRFRELTKLMQGPQSSVETAAVRLDRSSQAVLAKVFRGDPVVDGEA